MASSPAPSPAESGVRGKIIEAEVKVSVDAGRPLPLVCGLYAVESPGGVWLCAYYGFNRSVFDYLPQKGAEIVESELGIAFHAKKLVPKEQYTTSSWEEFKKAYFMSYSAHGE